MNITDAHVAVLRAQLNAEIEDYQQRKEQLRSDPDRGGYNVLLGTAFFLEMERRFPETSTVGDIIEFVGQVRAQFDSKGEWLDPAGAEMLIRNIIFGEGDFAEFDNKTLGLQIVLLTASIRDRGLQPDEIDAFLDNVRRVAIASY